MQNVWSETRCIMKDRCANGKFENLYLANPLLVMRELSLAILGLYLGLLGVKLHLRVPVKIL